MREIIENVRAKVSPFINGGLPYVDFQIPEALAWNSPSSPDFSNRFIRRNPGIPKENYDKLSKLVPISWL